MVKWKGYPDSDNTWENPDDLPDNLIDLFNNKNTPKKVSAKSNCLKSQLDLPWVMILFRRRKRVQLKKLKKSQLSQKLSQLQDVNC